MIYSLGNNTYEIDNGYLFENVKQGNYYEATKQIMHTVPESAVFGTQEVYIGVVSIYLDLESKHLESSVNHLLDVIGNIGGSFELISYIILSIYIILRKNLYFYTIIKRIRDFQMSQDELDVKVYRKRGPKRAEETKIPNNTKRFNASEHRTSSNNQPQYKSLGMYRFDQKDIYSKSSLLRK